MTITLSLKYSSLKCNCTSFSSDADTAVQVILIVLCSTDRLCINHPFTAKCKFWVRPVITARSAQDRYSVNAIGVIYGVLATLCRSTKRRLCIVSPGAMPLLPSRIGTS